MTLDKWENPPNQTNKDILALCNQIDDHILEIKEMLPFANCNHNYKIYKEEDKGITCTNCGEDVADKQLTCTHDYPLDKFNHSKLINSHYGYLGEWESEHCSNCGKIIVDVPTSGYRK
jgi:ribosomal protein S27E